MKVKDERTFVYQGPVMAKKRPRATVRWKAREMPDGTIMRQAVADSYGDKRDKTYEGMIRQAYLEDWAGTEPMTGPVKIEIHAIFETHEQSKKKRRLAIGRLCTKKPDIDNIVKSVMDALNRNEKIGFEGAYRDDKQVAMVVAEKKWGLS